MLTNEQVAKFQEIYEKRFGLKLSFKDAHEKAISLVRMIELTYRPMDKRDLGEIRKRRKEINIA